MAKLMAFLVGTFLLLVLAYSVLAPSFAPLINWIGPVAGVPLQFLLGITFAIFGNPFTYHAVVLVWISVGATVGLLVRKTGSSVRTALLVYSTSWLLLTAMGAIVFSHFLVTGSVASFPSVSGRASIPSPPPGTNIAAILDEPILNGLPSLFADISGGGGSLAVIESSWEPTILSLISNLSILLLSAGITGYFSRRLSTSTRRRGSTRVTALTILFLLTFSALSFAGTVPSAAAAGARQSVQVTDATAGSTCVSATSSSDGAQVPLTYGVGQPNLWNTASSQGQDTMCYEQDDGLTASIALTSIVLSDTSVDVVGYSEAAYGDNLDGNAFGSQSSSFEAFPLSVDTLTAQSLWANVTYSLSGSRPLIMDAGFDLWLKAQESGSPVSSDFELLIVPYDTFVRCLSTSSFSDEAYVNLVEESLTWNICKQAGSGGAPLYAFSLGLLNQISSGAIAVNLSDFVSYVSSNIANSPISSYYLMGVEFGTEFAVATADGVQITSDISMNWGISSFSLNYGNTEVSIVASTFVGAENIVQVSSPSILSSGSCPGPLSPPQKCFSLQQNLFIATRLQTTPLYWVQNIVVFGVDSEGNDWVAPTWEIWSGSTMVACYGIPVPSISGLTQSTCLSYLTYQKIQSPATLDLTTKLSGGMLDLSSSADGTSLLSSSCPGGLNCILFPSLPTDSHFDTSTSGGQSMAPELDVVGPLDGGSVTFTTGVTVGVSSSVELAGASFSKSLVEYPTIAPWTAESAKGLTWSCTGANSGSFLYEEGGTTQGVGYHPDSSGQPVVTCITPTSGSSQGGTAVDIWGAGFTGASAIDFGTGNSPSQYTVVSDSDISATSPAGTGTVDITVTTSMGTSATSSSDQFTYVVAPPFYLESVLSELNPQGGAVSLYGFLSSSTNPPPFPLLGSASTAGEEFLALFTQSGGLTLLPSAESSALSSYTSLVPPTLLFLGAAGDCASSEADASQVAAGVGSTLGLSTLSLLVASPLYPAYYGGQDNQVCLRIYESVSGLDVSGPAIAEKLLPSIHSTGLIKVLEDGLESNQLIPDATPTSVDATVLVTGFTNAAFLNDFFLNLFPISTPPIPSNQVVSFAGAITLKEGLVHSSNYTHTVSLANLLGYSSPISFAPDSTVSTIALGIPSGSLTSGGLFPSDGLVEVTTPGAGESVFSGSQVLSSSSMPQGSVIIPSGVRSSFTGLFPANLEVTKTLVVSGADVLVNVTVRNLDDSPITLVGVDDSAFLSSYSSGAELVSGTPSNHTMLSLVPGSQASFMYTVHLTGIGSYYSPPATITYLLNGTSFTAESNAVTYQKGSPGPLEALGDLLNIASGSVNKILGTTMSSPDAGYLVVYGILAILVVSALYSELSSFKRGRK